jgi:hypothetical protein
VLFVELDDVLRLHEVRQAEKDEPIFEFFQHEHGEPEIYLLLLEHVNHRNVSFDDQT